LLCDTERGEAPRRWERGEWCRYAWLIWVVVRCISIIILLTMNAICVKRGSRAVFYPHI
jgi:hypothetical protein